MERTKQGKMSKYINIVTWNVLSLNCDVENDMKKIGVAVATQQPDVWYRHIPNVTYSL
jgi:hypothetical protein